MIFTEQQELIRKLGRNMAEKELTKEVLDEVEVSGKFPEDILQKMANAGIFGIKVPQTLGGAGADNVAYVIIMEEFAKVSGVASIYVSTPNSLSSGPLLISGTDEQIRRYLVPVVKGEKKICFGLTEPGSGSDAGSLQSTAVRDGDYYILNGRKTFITMAPLADFAVIYARTDPSKRTRGISAFIVDMKSPGISCGKPEDKMGIIGCATSDIIMEDVRVPTENLLGEEGYGFINAMKTLDVGRIGVAAQSIGIAGGALQDAVNYVQERKQFGRKLAEFQGLRFMIADMATELQAARELTYKAAQLKDMNHPDAGQFASMAKYFASETCNKVCARALQIHGGYGFIKDYPIERRYRDCRVFTIYEGTSQVQQMVIANKLLKK